VGEIRCEYRVASYGERNTRSLDCAESFAGANDSASLGMTVKEDPLGMTESGTGVVISWIFACVDPNEKWWLRLRGNPKRSGEISQAAFLLKAETLGFDVALPWGDNQKFDFVVWRGDGRAVRVQVKGTGRLHRRGYEVQPVHATRRGGKKRYTKRDIDVIAAHVQPEDAWYLIPIEKVGRAKSLRLYPGIHKRVRAWGVGGVSRGGGNGGGTGGTCWKRPRQMPRRKADTGRRKRRDVSCGCRQLPGREAPAA